MRLTMCVYAYPDDRIVGEEVICLGGALHGRGGARGMVEHMMTHWRISAEQAVLSFAGCSNGYLYAVVVRTTKDREEVVLQQGIMPQPPKEQQPDTLF